LRSGNRMCGSLDDDRVTHLPSDCRGMR
jgi:hypothetical protein